MNNTFDIKRFTYLLQKETQENWKKHLMLVFTFYGVLTLIFMLISFPRYDYPEGNLDYLDTNLLSITMFLGVALGCITASRMMESMSSKTKRISYLMNPASSFEKYLSSWLIVTVGFILTVVLVFFLADATRVLICSIKFPDVNVHFIQFDNLIAKNRLDNYSYSGSYLFNNAPTFILAIISGFFLQSLFVLGSTFWQKNTFIKTFSAGAIIFFSFLLICWGAISIVFADGMDGYGDAFRSTLRNIIPEQSVEKNSLYFAIGCLSFFTLLNWALGFFRFKESEVIKRW